MLRVDRIGLSFAVMVIAAWGVVAHEQQASYPKPTEPSRLYR
jgi:hypothetical protein